MNLVDILLLVLLAAVIVLALRKAIRLRRQGGCSCGSAGCTGCTNPLCSGCTGKQANQDCMKNDRLK